MTRTEILKYSKIPQVIKASRTVTLALGILLVALMAGCGSSSSSSGTSGPRDSTAAITTNSEGASKQFAGPKGENTAATFGTEADDGELEAAAQVVAASLKARGTRDWAGQCATLSAKMQEAVDAGGTGDGSTSCTTQLGLQGRNAPPSVLKDNLKGSVVVLREKGGQGFALYHGNDGKDWALPMEKEGDEWKVAALIAEELPR